MEDKTKKELDMNVDTNEFIEVLRKDYSKLLPKTRGLFAFDKYIDLVLRQEELKRIDRHNMEYNLK